MTQRVYSIAVRIPGNITIQRGITVDKPCVISDVVCRKGGEIKLKRIDYAVRGVMKAYSPPMPWRIDQILRMGGKAKLVGHLVDPGTPLAVTLVNSAGLPVTFQLDVVVTEPE